MREIGRIYRELHWLDSKASRQAASTLIYNRCLRLIWLYFILIFGASIVEALPTVSSARVIRILEREPVILNCTNKTLSGQVSYQWSHQDSSLFPKHINKNTSALVFPVTNRTYSGIYHCHVTINSLSSFNDSVQLIVQYPPTVLKVITSNNYSSLKLGESIQISCIIDADPPVQYVTWTKNKKNYKVSTANISISRLNCSDSGEYECFPFNGVSLPSNNGSINLTVKDKPGPIKLVHYNSTSTTITISWQQLYDSCLPVHYFVEWELFDVNNNKTGIELSNQSFTIPGLIPFKVYGVYLWARNSEGNSSFILQKITTKIAGPSEPLSVLAKANIRCTSTAFVFVNWSRPVLENGPIGDLHYQVFYRDVEKNNSSLWLSTNTTKWTNYTIYSLDHSTTYLVKVRACYKCESCCSSYSNGTRVFVKNSEDVCDIKNSGDTESGGLDTVAIALVVIAVVFVIGVIVLVIFIIKCRNRNSYLCCTMPFKGLFNIEPTSNANLSRASSYKERREREAIPYDRFWNHVILRHADSNYRFSSEFESLQGVIEKNKKLTWTHSQRPENQSKNRFANVVAYDQTRVVLSMIDNAQGSHYINANYVDSNNSMNFYIATQGPLANTIADFWRMVWEQNSRVIVMITNIIEKGRHKCTQYWPTKTKKCQDHGQLRITFLSEEHFAFYSRRTFEVRPLTEYCHYMQDPTDEAIKPIVVQQFHFTGWPDHGVPDPGYEIPVIDYIFKSTAAQIEGAGPIIVHCSAGVGRSGAYIVIDSMVKRIHDSGDVDIFNFLCQIRQQRNHLVQEESQYIFVHDVLLEYIRCNFLFSLPKKALSEHLHKLRIGTHSPGKNKLTAEFERLKGIKIQDFNLKDGQKKCNINKNRHSNITPVDSCRVKLYPRPGQEGSDYINASYIDGFWRREAYIATQHPLESTIFDFWRMIWQENCRSIVMLISKEEVEKTNNYPRYLPVVHDTARFGVYEVTMDSETARGDLMIRDLKMISQNEPGEIRRIRHFHFLHWPEDSKPWSGQSLLQLVSKVDDWEKDINSKSKPFDTIGPIVVHCSTGVGRTGIYCLLHTLWHQVVREEVVSVYAYSRLYFHQRLEFLLTQAQYEYIYDTMVEYIEADCSLYLV